jgi:nicotinamidase/pyrazinamidase
MDISMNKDQTCVIVVDLQRDFTLIKEGSLAVPRTDQSYIDKAVAATTYLKAQGFKIFGTQDFHPPDHISFYTCHKNKAAYETIEIEGRAQILWPSHCVQGTKNAEILIDTDVFTAIIQKGMDKKYDSYSGFFDDSGTATGLDERLKSYRVNTLIIYGLATDYCVKATAMDAVKSGYKVILIENLCRGVAKDTTLSALKEMESAGIKILPEISQDSIK